MRHRRLIAFLCKQIQVDQGVDAVIVDSVLAIRKGLTAAAAELNGTAKKLEQPTAADVVMQVQATKMGVVEAISK